LIAGLPTDQQRTGFPLDISEAKLRHIASPKPEARQQQQDCAIAALAWRIAITRSEQVVHLLRRQIPWQFSQAPRSICGYGLVEIGLAEALDGEIAQKHKIVDAGAGFIERPGALIFNQYEPPVLVPRPGNVDPWINLIERVSPEDVEAILDWLAHRVQRPGEKLNHAMVLGGEQRVTSPSRSRTPPFEPVEKLQNWRCRRPDMTETGPRSRL
jgi:hypothetical protein